MEKRLFTDFKKNGATNPPKLQPIKIKLLAILAFDPLINLATSAKRYGVHKDWEKAINTIEIR